MIRDNILILSVSRKTLLCRWILEAARKYKLGVLGSDLDPNAPALSVLDGVVALPGIESPDFMKELLFHVKKDQIKLIIPTRDDELLFLSNVIGSFESVGCSVLCNKRDITQQMIDKRTFTRFCIEEIGFRNMRVISAPGEATDKDFPLFFRGEGARRSLKMKISNESELKAAFVLSHTGIATTFLEGQEVSVDGYVSREGRIIYNVPRTRDVVLGGESIVTTTIYSRTCTEVSGKIFSKSGVKGPVVLQGMLKDGDFMPFEINLRFGGASVLSFKAAHSGPDLAIREYVLGENLMDTYSYKPNLKLFKDFKETYFSTNGAYSV